MIQIAFLKISWMVWFTGVHLVGAAIIARAMGRNWVLAEHLIMPFLAALLFFGLVSANYGGPVELSAHEILLLSIGYAVTGIAALLAGIRDLKAADEG
jgi:hypothetical protein